MSRIQANYIHVLEIKAKYSVLSRRDTILVIFVAFFWVLLKPCIYIEDSGNLHQFLNIKSWLIWVHTCRAFPILEDNRTSQKGNFAAMAQDDWNPVWRLKTAAFIAPSVHAARNMPS